MVQILSQVETILPVIVLCCNEDNVVKTLVSTQIAKMPALDLLEVRFSKLTTVPTLPQNMRLTKLYLFDNPFMTSIPRLAFALLPNLLVNT